MMMICVFVRPREGLSSVVGVVATCAIAVEEKGRFLKWIIIVTVSLYILSLSTK